MAEDEMKPASSTLPTDGQIMARIASRIGVNSGIANRQWTPEAGIGAWDSASVCAGDREWLFHKAQKCRERVRELEAALRWYADLGHCGYTGEDLSKRARKALEARDAE